MKRTLTSRALAALLVLSLAGCGAGGPELGAVFAGTVNDYEGVTMSVVEGSAYPCQVSVEILNATDAEIDSGNGADFFVQAGRGSLASVARASRRESFRAAYGADARCARHSTITLRVVPSLIRSMRM